MKGLGAWDWLHIWYLVWSHLDITNLPSPLFPSLDWTHNGPADGSHGQFTPEYIFLYILYSILVLCVLHIMLYILLINKMIVEILECQRSLEVWFIFPITSYFLIFFDYYVSVNHSIKKRRKKFDRIDLFFAWHQNMGLAS